MATSVAEAIVPAACPQALSVSGESLQRAAFHIVDGGLDELLQIAYRHRDVTVPDAEGVSPRQPIRDAFEASIPLVFVGAVTVAGAAVPRDDQMAELAITRRWFVANIVEPPATTAGTRAATLTDTDGTVLTASLHTLAFTWQQAGLPPGAARAVWRVEVVEGRWS